MPKLPKQTTLFDLLLAKLQALYDVEVQITKVLPKLVKKAKNRELKQAFSEHLKETQNQVKRLEEAFDRLGEKHKKLKVEAIRGLAEDGDWVAKNVTDPGLDAGLIAAAQYVEHYEMAGYGSAIEWAKELGEKDIANLLEQTLEEEKAADEKLNDLATSGINQQAAFDMLPNPA